ncbi:hypothetical protein ACFL6S_35335 [Candidatus Poribacteria bacterium]
MRFQTCLMLLPLLFVCLGSNLPAVSAQTETTTDDGGIVWAANYIYARGMGLPPRNAIVEARRKVYARLAAKTNAQRHLLEVIKGIRIDAKVQMVNMMVTDSKVRSEVTGHLGKFANIVEDSEKWDGEYYELQMRIPIKGFYRIVYEREEDKFLPPESFEERSVDESECTGVVIDCRGLKLTACVRFQIISEDKRYMYGVKNALFRVAADRGLVGYSTSVEKAMKDKRVGRKPRLIKAIGIKNEVDVVIRSADVEFIHSIAHTTDILAKCKVIVVMD